MYNLHLTSAEHVQGSVIRVSVSETNEDGSREHLFTAEVVSNEFSEQESWEPLWVFLMQTYAGIGKALSVERDSVDNS